MSVEIRSGLQAGDIGEITRLHGEIYAAEYGLGRAGQTRLAGRP
jgi:hypothetical protein